ncbi:MAG: type II toxin-antitoxin system RelE/ParE family toxin [Leptolyngbyaceae cyanobacterium SL_5_9]|nr:type II toxin-antitoxin system RelE/ParE family toxin [Leptolyngbyaceae cyanobacterium SL_5_9]NJO76649.1 type II toxin-antitoxin system RelE/ParE family toxin [Leptolyngbyaceae cyanobacterium RM1_406_9]
MACEFHPEAKRELFDIVAYYDSINLDLGNQFIQEVEQTLERIEQFPQAWASLSKNSRRCRLTSFPYGIVYQIAPQGIMVLAVMHLQRKPNYWSDRTI